MILCCMEWKPYWSKENHQYAKYLHDFLQSYLSAHNTPWMGMQHYRDFYRYIFLLLLSTAVTSLCTLLCYIRGLRDQSFQAQWLTGVCTYCSFPNPILSSSGPHLLFLLLWIYHVSVDIQSTQCKLIPPTTWFILFRKEAVKHCVNWDSPRFLTTLKFGLHHVGKVPARFPAFRFWDSGRTEAWTTVVIGFIFPLRRIHHDDNRSPTSGHKTSLPSVSTLISSPDVSFPCVKS